MNTPVYLDWNATAPPWPETLAAMLATAEHTWANPSSMHGPGQAARRALMEARATVARFFGAAPAELVFTSGATEANHTAVRRALAARRGGGRERVLMSAVEHPGLLALAAQLRAEGTPVDVLPVDADGRVDPRAAEALLNEHVAVISVMGANNETGVCMPVAELAARAHARGAWLHVDATQCAGRMPLDFAASGVDLMSVSAHKIGGPKGVGALLVRKGVVLPPLMPGRQERQRRGGTENLPGIAGFAAACARSGQALAADAARMQALRDALEQGLCAALPGTVVIGRGAPRLPNTSCVSFAGLDAEPVLTALERAGVVASSGAACAAGGTQASHVLRAMGLDERQARSGVRLSLGPRTTADEIQRAIAAATRAIAPLLAAAGLPATAARGAPTALIVEESNP